MGVMNITTWLWSPLWDDDPAWMSTEAMRYFGAFMAIAMMLSNLGTIVINDSQYLISAGHVENVTAVADDEKGYSPR